MPLIIEACGPGKVGFVGFPSHEPFHSQPARISGCGDAGRAVAGLPLFGGSTLASRGKRVSMLPARRCSAGASGGRAFARLASAGVRRAALPMSSIVSMRFAQLAGRDHSKCRNDGRQGSPIPDVAEPDHGASPSTSLKPRRFGASRHPGRLGHGRRCFCPGELLRIALLLALLNCSPEVESILFADRFA